MTNNERKDKLARLMASKKEQAAARAWERAQQKEQHLIKEVAGAFEQAQAVAAALQDAVVTDELRAIYTMGGITLDDSQITALEGMLENRFAALIGYAGSGKTTVIRFLVERLKSVYKPVEIEHKEFNETTDIIENAKRTTLPIAFAAFTGRASEVISSKLPKELQANVSTIHRLLGYHPSEVDVPDPGSKTGYKSVVRFIPAYDATNKLPYKCLILDEAGMITGELWNNILAAITSDCRVYLVGDISQLPPVMGVSPLPFAMRHLPTYELATIHRQADGSPIIMNATMLRQGKIPNKNERNSFGKDFIYYPVEAYIHGKFNGEVFKMKTCEIIRKLYNQGRFDPWQDIVLTPIARFESEGGFIYHSSAAAFNIELRQLFNADATRVLIKGGMRAFDVTDVAVGDKLMITRNGVCESANGKSVGVTNGMLGRVVEIRPNPLYRGTQAETNSAMIDEVAKGGFSFSVSDINKALAATLGEVETPENDDESTRQCSHIVALEILGRKGMIVNLRTAGDFSNLLFAYAVTVHKSQGGEYRNVFVMVYPEGASMLLAREWLYTAVTRAQKQCVIMYDPNALTQCLKRQRIKGATLVEKAASVEALYTNSGRKDAKPIMPKPELIKREAQAQAQD